MTGVREVEAFKMMLDGKKMVDETGCVYWLHKIDSLVLYKPCDSPITYKMEYFTFLKPQPSEFKEYNCYEFTVLLNPAEIENCTKEKKDSSINYYTSYTNAPDTVKRYKVTIEELW
ncbi:hypothetical protein [Fluviispira vulneris]|uniref:hypothetical protein n=1 Tax=Fluviispira vulneris TaxID=2763012 RepID=UPI001648D9B2|nr:hypothetical protein [Fluviispira vulneris]